MLQPGERVDRYEVESLVGQGGMAAVYRARHRHLGSIHALKVLLVTSPDVCARLLQEGRVQALLRHPNVVAVHDVFLVDRAPVLVMEFVDGPSLDQCLGGVALPLNEALAVFQGIVAGVGAAHAAGVVHRDLKPGNVLLAPAPTGAVPKVMDFGLVRTVGLQAGVTRTGDLVGTPAYMAPEQIRDPAAVDTRADMWALGCILYELTTGGLVFSDLDVFELYDAIRAGRYVDPDDTAVTLPEEVAQAIRDLLVVDREHRLGSCSELHHRLYGAPLPIVEAPDITLQGPAPSASTRCRW